MVGTLDIGYLSTPTGILNIAEIVSLIAGLISVAFTSRLYCELADNLQSVYPDLSTVAVRSVFQAFSILCLTTTIVIFLAHLYGLRFLGRNFVYLNQVCLVINIIMGLMMISIGICAALWEDKLRRTPGIIRRGYLRYEYQYVFKEQTHPSPGAAAAAATFALIAGILFIVEACTRPMLNNNASRLPTYTSDRPGYTVSPNNQRSLINDSNNGERIIPIETSVAPYRV
ncbi:unnamed protein product [Adineta steineri]|uniref:Uncharacterized protein n=1 Tax=Adineta steineri TaxID=433720 RepID=A0A813SLZ1_9BILA|nr:unnamed protein product [Adineta steineri]CAF0802531.1 unnamed protein product [Adineta steineri]CAF3563807.1 unnamed protein product [Adineta steineri]CAF3727195.1 unnamed protein product [Adineta steineri]